MKEKARIKTAFGPAQVFFPENNNNAYVIHIGDPILEVIDSESRKILKKIDLSKGEVWSDSFNGKNEVERGIWKMSNIQSSDPRRFSTNSQTVGGAVGGGFTPNKKELWVPLLWLGKLARIDVQKNSLIELLPIGREIMHVAFTKEGSKTVGWVTVTGENRVARVIFDEGQKGADLDGSISTGARPHGVVVSNDLKTLWTTLEFSDQVSYSDIGSRKLIGSFFVGELPKSILKTDCFRSRLEKSLEAVSTSEIPLIEWTFVRKKLDSEDFAASSKAVKAGGNLWHFSADFSLNFGESEQLRLFVEGEREPLIEWHQDSPRGRITRSMILESKEILGPESAPRRLYIIKGNQSPSAEAALAIGTPTIIRKGKSLK